MIPTKPCSVCSAPTAMACLICPRDYLVQRVPLCGAEACTTAHDSAPPEIRLSDSAGAVVGIRPTLSSAPYFTAPHHVRLVSHEVLRRHGGECAHCHAFWHTRTIKAPCAAGQQLLAQANAEAHAQISAQMWARSTGTAMGDA